MTGTTDRSILEPDRDLPDWLRYSNRAQRGAYDVGLSDGREGVPDPVYLHSSLRTMYVRGYAFGGCIRYAEDNDLWDAWVLLAARRGMSRTAIPRTVAEATRSR